MDIYQPTYRPLPLRMFDSPSEESKAALLLAKMLASRMERLSADSAWARLASGARGSLLKSIEELETQAGYPTAAQAELRPALGRLQTVMRICFQLLERAAQDLTR